jgi:hypothetical protein
LRLSWAFDAVGRSPIDRRGQPLIEPELKLEGWTISLTGGAFDAAKAIAPHADHGRHGQFRALFKIDLGLTLLPSGNFDTNYLVCQIAARGMNILRLMGQRALLGPEAPVRHCATEHMCMKAVTQELIYRAGRLIAHRRQLIPSMAGNDRVALVFRCSVAQLANTA